MTITHVVFNLLIPAKRMYFILPQLIKGVGVSAGLFYNYPNTYATRCIRSSTKSATSKHWVVNIVYVSVFSK